MTLLLIHLMSTAAMAGLIWFVQVVHYPLFSAVGGAGFNHYEQQHQRLTSYVVGPLMAAEGVSALALAATSTRELIGWPLIIAGWLLLAAIHSSTVLLQVPAHARLTDGFDPVVTRRLVKTNWIRTIGWTTRTAVAAVMVAVAAT